MTDPRYAPYCPNGSFLDGRRSLCAKAVGHLDDHGDGLRTWPNQQTPPAPAPDPHLYTHRPLRVAAIEWTGDNFPDVEAFLTGRLTESNPRNEPESVPDMPGRTIEYNTVQFDAWGDDQEVDPGSFIVIYLDSDPDDREGDIVDADTFHILFEREATRG
jgi:hypothetical protein